jgi:hypothetical protein
MAWSTSGGGEVLKLGFPSSPRTIHGTSGWEDGAGGEAFFAGAGSAKVMLKSGALEVEVEAEEVARRRRGGRRRPKRRTQAGRERRGWREAAAVVAAVARAMSRTMAAEPAGARGACAAGVEWFIGYSDIAARLRLQVQADRHHHRRPRREDLPTPA